ETVDCGGELPVGACEVSQLVCEHGGEMIAFQQATGEHQGIAAHCGVWLGIVEHEPARGLTQRHRRAVTQQVKRVVIGGALTLGWFASAEALPPPPSAPEWCDERNE